jgi:hypothetical protein
MSPIAPAERLKSDVNHNESNVGTHGKTDYTAHRTRA